MALLTGPPVEKGTSVPALPIVPDDFMSLSGEETSQNTTDSLKNEMQLLQSQA